MLRLLAGFVAFGLLLAYTGDLEAAQKRKHKVAGTIVGMKTEKGHSVLTIHSAGKKGKSGKDHHVTVTKSTKVDVVAGKKGKKSAAVVSVSALHTGAHVVAHVHGHHADKIDIHGSKKKKA